MKSQVIRSIVCILDGDKRKFLIIKKIDKKNLYASSRMIEGINMPSNTPVRDKLPESIVDCSSGLFSCRGNES
ncbi:hypothetical protein DPMN_093244 [Dreissena polymorpha]|uniref:Uncharacterized protein n=1 Tax=Dreissena polymorpha TaxID=45954 RepID=A0A9D4R0Q3_DREPO|nr:hypothetical protein DPMN_093244 [Dreissena polymorpha]